MKGNCISRAELRINVIGAFDGLDRDRDDSLSPSEIPGVAKKLFMATDSDKNGRLSVFEYFKVEFLRFENYDVNRNGFITAQEIDAYRRRTKN